MNAASMMVDFTDTPCEAHRFSGRRSEISRHQSRQGDQRRRPGGIVGGSRVLRQVMQQVDAVASTDATVLITGESGTGKELLAKEVHRRGRRSRRPFVKVNCSAIPREIFESEFFGHARGAFTGAVSERPGRFQIADGGTIFLDEIGDLPVEMQPKLLRVLQEGEYERVGADGTRTVDVRVIAATNHDLADEVRARRFRQDLFYRLNVFPLELPPLRARKGDIPAAGRPHHREDVEAASDAGAASHARGYRVAPTLRLARQHPRAAERDRTGGHSVARARDFASMLRFRASLALRVSRYRPRTVAVTTPFSPTANAAIASARIVMRALERSEGRIYGRGGAADLLQINPTTLASRLRALKIVAAKVR